MKCLLLVLLSLAGVSAVADNVTTNVTFTVSYSDKLTSEQLPSDIFKSVVINTNVPFEGQSTFQFLYDGSNDNNLCIYLGYPNGVDYGYSVTSTLPTSDKVIYVDQNQKLEVVSNTNVFQDLACLK